MTFISTIKPSLHEGIVPLPLAKHIEPKPNFLPTTFASSSNPFGLCIASLCSPILIVLLFLSSSYWGTTTHAQEPQHFGLQLALFSHIIDGNSLVLGTLYNHVTQKDALTTNLQLPKCHFEPENVKYAFSSFCSILSLSAT